MAAGKITKTRVDALQPGESIWDAETRGFGVRRQSRDATYVLKARIKGRQRFLTIGRHGSPWTPDTARQRAKALLGEIAAGRDPAATRDEGKSVPTLAVFAERYIRDYAKRHKGSRTVEEDQRNLRLHILPALGNLQMTDITPGAVAAFQAERGAYPTNANRCRALLSHIFTIAAKWGVAPQGTNPCTGIEKFPEQNRERFLTEGELMRLGDALQQVADAYPERIDGRVLPFQRKSAEDPRAIALIRLLLLTGARLSEIQKLKWEWIDWGTRIARLPTSKTGAKNLNLPIAAIEIIRALPKAEANPYVLWGDKPGTHFNGIQKAWQRIRYVAGLSEVRIHDLRHSFASRALRNGENFFIVGRALGHRQVQTTQRYVHLDVDPAQGVADRTANSFVVTMSKAKVHPGAAT